MIAVVIISVLVVAFGFVVFWGAPYVPSHRKEVAAAFRELYRLTKKDVLVDLGSGDGVVLRVAAEKVNQAIGYELNPLLVWISRLLSRRFHNVQIHTLNFWQHHFPETTTVIYIYFQLHATWRNLRQSSNKKQTI